MCWSLLWLLLGFLARGDGRNPYQPTAHGRSGMPGITPLVAALWKRLEAPRGIEGTQRGQCSGLWLLAGQQGCES